MSDTTDLKRTPLYNAHVSAGAKMVPFAGWEMPVQYTGVIPEHRLVRSSAGLFDVSHMGEITVEGKDAFKLLSLLTCNDLSKLEPGRAQYSALTTPRGGVVDDIIIYMYSAEKFFVCVNASNSDKDFAWIKEHNKFGVNVQNLSSSYGQIAIQGPEATRILSELPGFNGISSMRSFSFEDRSTDWGKVIVARTGYTGEDGFEVFTSAPQTEGLWKALLEYGGQAIAPIGLGARDTLRLEACLPLHGHELSEEISAIESGLSWIVKPAKGDFLGKEVLEKQQKEGSPRSLIGFFIDDPGIARQDDTILAPDGRTIGVITSGTRTPTLDRALGLGLVESTYNKIDQQLIIAVRGRQLKAHVVAKPFYKRKK